MLFSNHKAVWVCFAFFLTVIALGQNKTKNVFFWQMTTEQKKRSCFKKFLRVLFSLSEVKLSQQRRFKFFFTLFLSLKNKLNQKENFHYTILVLISMILFLKLWYFDTIRVPFQQKKVILIFKKPILWYSVWTETVTCQKNWNKRLPKKLIGVRIPEVKVPKRARVQEPYSFTSVSLGTGFSNDNPVSCTTERCFHRPQFHNPKKCGILLIGYVQIF